MEQKKTIKLLIANDHEIVNRGVIMGLKKVTTHIEIVGSANNFEEIFTLLPQTLPDVLLTDDYMPPGDLFKLGPLLRQQYPNLKIIIHSMHTDTNYFKNLMPMGDGWVSMTSEIDEIIKAIETVYCGGYFYYLKGYDKEL